MGDYMRKIKENTEMSKICEWCGKEFFKPEDHLIGRWEKRRFCGKACSTRNVWATSGYRRESVPIEDRFWPKVDKSKNGCWEWIGSKDGKGYGTLSRGKNKSPEKAHRLSWKIHFGKIKKELEVCHACDNPSCVNPSHLMLGTRMANIVDAMKKGRMPTGEGVVASKLKSSQVSEIISLHNNGARSCDSAEMFGVSRSTIADIIYGRTWNSIK